MSPHGELLIRTEASHELGHGHVARCLALAREAEGRGIAVCFDGRCAYSVALGRPHQPQALQVLEHDGQTYHLCGADGPDGCDATAMWKNCGELLRADAYRQWQLLAQR